MSVVLKLLCTVTHLVHLLGRLWRLLLGLTGVLIHSISLLVPQE